MVAKETGSSVPPSLFFRPLQTQTETIKAASERRGRYGFAPQAPLGKPLTFARPAYDSLPAHTPAANPFASLEVL